MSEQYPGGYITKSPVVPTSSAAPGIWNLSQQAGYQGAGNWPSVIYPDSKFNYVTMLLHGDGTNGAQNNTYLDSSSSPKTITRNGNVPQGSFSPYGSNWSNYFDGTGDYLTAPSNTAFAFGTGAYTVEAWVYVTARSSQESVVFASASAAGAFNINVGTNGQFSVSKYGTGYITTGNVGDVPLNQWVHVAAVRSSTSANGTKLYINGALATTGTDSENWTVSSAPIVGGFSNLSSYFITGYISNLRVVKGTALYTSAFTPSATPLTAVSGTALLTCQSNRFVDNSASPLTITVNGNTSVQRFNPFGTSTAYSTATIGGSGYFDGSGDYLTVGATTSFTLPANFTVEFWAYPTALSGVCEWVSKEYGLQIYTSGTSWGAAVSSSNDSSYIFSTVAGVAVLNTWQHIALTRSGSSYTFFVNGAIVYSSSSGSAPSMGSSSPVTIGAWSNSGYVVTGYMSDVRIVVGTAVYTTTFTPPTAPLTAITNTSLLLNMTNGAIYDNAMMNVLETSGNVQISTSVKKYGTGSIAFDGATDLLYSPNTTSMSFRTGDFTVEFWMLKSDTNNGYIITCGVNTTAGNWNLALISSNLYWQSRYGVTNLYFRDATSLLDGNWHHVAITRASGTQRMFFDGVLQGATVSDSTDYIVTTGAQIGIGVLNFGGYLDDLRITNGYARYTANFTPPTAAFPNIGP